MFIVSAAKIRFFSDIARVLGENLTADTPLSSRLSFLSPVISTKRMRMERSSSARLARPRNLMNAPLGASGEPQRCLDYARHDNRGWALGMTKRLGARNDNRGWGLLDATMAGSAIVTSCVGKIMSAQTIIPAEVAGIICWALRLELGVLSAGRETGTVLVYVREVAVAYDAGLGVVAVERLQELVERGLLLGGTGVGVLALGTDAAFVTDAERTAVVASGMSTPHRLG